jgi:YidC/Oxa1 family membrane protein insertase
MDFILTPIAGIFGKMLFLIYNTVGFHSYALALLLFTIAVKLLLLPLSIKQIRSGQKMQEIQPELTRIQERYKNDKEKLNEEMTKLYQEKKYNPASGCLPLIVQMPILFALFYVIRMPMTYMLDVPKLATGDLIVMAIEAKEPDFMTTFPNLEKMKKVKFDDIKDNKLTVYNDFRQVDPYIEIKIIDYIDKNPAVLTTAIESAPDKITAYYDLIEVDPAKRSELQKGYAADLALYTKRTSRLENFNIRMWNFFNFGVQPTLKWDLIKAEPGKYIPALLLLIIAVVTTFVSSALMMPKPNPNDKKSAQSGLAGKSMLWMSPIMTLWFGLTTPSGLALYWTINNVLSYAQQKLLTSHTKKDEGVTARDISNKQSTGNVIPGKSTAGGVISGKPAPGKVIEIKNSKKRGKNRR